jgi:hypothetical protein
MRGIAADAVRQKNARNDHVYVSNEVMMDRSFFLLEYLHSLVLRSFFLHFVARKLTFYFAIAFLNSYQLSLVRHLLRFQTSPLPIKTHLLHCLMPNRVIEWTRHDVHFSVSVLF